MGVNVLRTIIVGLGNPILTDDGVGVKTAWEIAKAKELLAKAQVDVIESSMGGLRLMETLVGYDKAILIDALLGQPGIVPGTIRRMSQADLRRMSPTQHSSSAHDTNLLTALDLGRELGLHLPTEIIIYAIAVENVMDFSEEPTPVVARAIPQAAALILQEIGNSQ